MVNQNNKLKLIKYLIQCKVASRRQAIKLIKEGHIKVNGKIVTNPFIFINPEKDHVKFDEKLIKPKPIKPIYIVLYKKKNILTLSNNPNKPSAIDVIKPSLLDKIFPVNPLDYYSEGIILLTNDGIFANIVSNPIYKIPKIFLIKLKGSPSDKDLKKLTTGIKIGEHYFKFEKIKVLKEPTKHTWIKALSYFDSVKKIKKMAMFIHHPVIKLKRIKIGPISAHTVPIGYYRFLNPMEMKFFKKYLEQINH